LFKFGILLSAAVAFCVLASPSQAVENPVERMQAIKPAAEAWVICTLRQADDRALQPERVETIVLAVFAACSTEETAYVKALADNGMSSQAKHLLRRSRQLATEQISLKILTKRKAGQ
jgi:hypothetical protein